PLWNGMDVRRPLVNWGDFTTDSGGGAPYKEEYVDKAGYVTDSVLVANFPVLFAAPNLRLSRAVLSGAIFQNGDRSYSLHNTTFAVRVNLDDLLATAELVKNPAYLGTDSPAYAVYKRTVCGLADIRYSVSASDASVPDDP